MKTARSLLAFAALAGVPPVAAQVVPVSAISAATPDGIRATVSVDHLVLHGRNFREVMEGFVAVAPRNEDGDLANAITEFDLMPHLIPARRRGACRVERLSIDVTVRILLPEWEDRAGAPTPERRRWDTFIAALEAHENAHRDITLRHAHTLLGRLEQISASSCPRLVRRVNGAVHGTWDALREAHAALDAADSWARHR